VGEGLLLLELGLWICFGAALFGVATGFGTASSFAFKFP
jgi:hypothetical protein